MKTVATATSSFERLARITSYTGHFRFLRTVAETGLVIPRTDLPSPYRSGPTHSVYRLPSGTLIFIVETAHKTYDVFKVPENVTPTEVL